VSDLVYFTDRDLGHDKVISRQPKYRFIG